MLCAFIAMFMFALVIWLGFFWRFRQSNQYPDYMLSV